MESLDPTSELVSAAGYRETRDLAMPMVVLYGGMFDPPHLGHQKALRAVINQLRPQRVIITVCGDPVHRAPAQLDAADRLRLARLAFTPLSGETAVEVSDLEIRTGHAMSTMDTFEELTDLYLYPETEFVLLMGADQNLGQWKRADELVQVMTPCIIPRAGYELETCIQRMPSAAHPIVLDIEPQLAASSNLRAELAAGQRSALVQVDPRIRAAVAAVYGLESEAHIVRTAEEALQRIGVEIPDMDE